MEIDGVLHLVGSIATLPVKRLVPNHMCIEGQGNAFWMDVLENGPSSLYAGFLRIDRAGEAV